MPDQAASPAPQNLERKLATILSADVAAYSRLMAEDEEQTLRIFRGHKEVFESLVAMHKGRIFNTAGDAILAEFGSAVEAVRCATEIQAALQTRNNQFPPERQVRFRIGVNLGDVMVQGQDLLGDGVNVAARLQTAAEPGGVCVSGSVYDQIRNKLSLSFNALGERSYKNIPQPVRTFSITEAEDHVLPSPRAGHRSWAGWAAGAVLLIVTGAGGYWAYTKSEQSNAEHARAREAAITARSEAKPAAADAQPGASGAVGHDPAPSSGHANVAAAKAESPGQSAAASKSETPVRITAATAPKPRSPANLTATAGRTSPDGVYSGQMCLGPVREAAGVCFKSQGTIAGGKFSSHWPGRAPGLIMYLVGEVSPSGDVRIHMHNEKDGKPQGRAELTGQLHDRQLDASGAFRNGRTANLSWHKEPGSPPASSASH